jgi:hypothetical protein
MKDLAKVAIGEREIPAETVEEAIELALDLGEEATVHELVDGQWRQIEQGDRRLMHLLWYV